jgi:hypothetical protein
MTKAEQARLTAVGDFFLQEDPLFFELANAVLVGIDDRLHLGVCDPVEELIDAALGLVRFCPESKEAPCFPL